MPEVNEKKVYDALLRCKGDKEVHIGDAAIGLSLNPSDIHNTDSPDSILWLNITLSLFGQSLKLKIPIPVEAEKGGIYGGALEDLKKFIERGRHFIELPMLVVAEAGYEVIEQKGNLPVRFTISQIPVRLLNEE